MSIDPMDPEPGEYISFYFERLIKNAKDAGGKVRGSYNSTPVECYPDSTVRELDYLWQLRRKK